jgi:hypothetical protein
MFTQLDYPYMATVTEKGKLVILERVNIHQHPPKTLVSLSSEATQKLLELLVEKLSTSGAAEQSVHPTGCTCPRFENGSKVFPMRECDGCRQPASG